ncbi:hypothetical protein PF008_g28867 [Phytophthora fragariae]|uniref:RxLR effector protein n=1 Tax=Phytophthora fragariae TaxID=53985 RepID=A0A6G0QA68_9STRA|nr:hypothetical protein PF008_g28867 [Phytophthora fragariae]
MGLCILLAVVSLLTSADAVLAFGHANQLTPFTAPNAQPWPPVLTSTQSSIALKRSLRADKKTQDNHDDVDDQEERAVQTNVFDHALDHVGNVVSTGLKESTFLKKLDDKIDLWYWRLMRKTLEKLRKQLGLDNLANIKDHSNYERWARFARSYAKRHKGYHVDGL